MASNSDTPKNVKEREIEATLSDFRTDRADREKLDARITDADHAEAYIDSSKDTHVTVPDYKVADADDAVTYPDKNIGNTTVHGTSTITDETNAVDMSVGAEGQMVVSDRICAQAGVDGCDVVILEQLESFGAGDMLKTTYDTDNSGVVDDSEKVNGLTVETAVPSGAIFTDTTYSDAEIKTKYENNADTNAFTDAEQSKLSGVESGAEENVNSDWNATSGDSEILNKPTLFESSEVVPSVVSATKKLTGFVCKDFTAQEQLSMSFNTSTGVYTVAPKAPHTEYSFIANDGAEVTITDPVTLSCPFATSRQWYICWDGSTGSLKGLNTLPNDAYTIIRDEVFVAEVIWNKAGDDTIKESFEGHGLQDWEDHYLDHNTVGTQFQSGLLVVPISDTTDVTVESGIIHDEDIPWATQTKASGATLQTVYRDGDDWDGAKFLSGVAVNGTGGAQYNAQSAGGANVVITASLGGTFDSTYTDSGTTDDLFGQIVYTDGSNRIIRDTTNNYWCIDTGIGTANPIFFNAQYYNVSGTLEGTYAGIGGNAASPAEGALVAGGGITWGLEDVPYNDFVCAHFFASPDFGSAEILTATGQGFYPTANAARTGAKNDLLSLAKNGFPFAEFKTLATAIAKNKGTYWEWEVVDTSTGAMIIDWRGTNEGQSTNTTVTDHDALQNVQEAGLGVLYGHINDQSQTIAGTKTFSSLSQWVDATYASVMSFGALTLRNLAATIQNKLSVTAGVTLLDAVQQTFTQLYDGILSHQDGADTVQIDMNDGEIAMGSVVSTDDAVTIKGLGVKAFQTEESLKNSTPFNLIAGTGVSISSQNSFATATTVKLGRSISVSTTVAVGSTVFSYSTDYTPDDWEYFILVNFTTGAPYNVRVTTAGDVLAYILDIPPATYLIQSPNYART